ncbi:VOC family protein [Lentibacillus saliphilus]|uniref:VOC family protein n=1 Tax=Lentibacillus saliphilus TaxID=2737028 RepID=UPI001C2F1760|nr:VOC family protein [Lentibacillus saliphilus]
MSFHIKHIDHIQLAAPEGCEAEARAFFQDILGFTEIPKPSSLQKRGGVWFRVGHQQIHIGIEDSFTPAQKAHPAFEVEHIQALKQHLTSHGITIQEDTNLPGAERFYVSDPFGNRLEFLEWIEV